MVSDTGWLEGVGDELLVCNSLREALPGGRSPAGTGRLRAIAHQQGGGLHDHAIYAVAALHGLLVDEGLLDGVRKLVRAQPFEGYDVTISDRGEWRYA